MSEVEPALKTSPAQLDSKLHSESADSNGTQLDVTPGTPTIKLDRLGPMVVNSDGVCSRFNELSNPLFSDTEINSRPSPGSLIGGKCLI
jgi:hypothetical protein